jgi:hypothetical protein
VALDALGGLAVAHISGDVAPKPGKPQAGRGARRGRAGGKASKIGGKRKPGAREN